MTVHDAIPKRKWLIGQFHLFIKPASAGFCFYRAAGWMTVHDAIPKRKAAYRSVSPLHKTRQCKLAGFCFYRAAG
ncbi:hypothetical protein EOG09_22975 [Salmonella enterica]|nr:hypothetical protein [Salmonella enterica subsp. enterica serovar Montevideo]EAB1648775.1 hypothetical protein [Salmonella enterica]EAP4148965.1 hypothetical protein [Salmonella enterica subsp. enterica serovar Minnesota]EAS6805380.1 hypothetical protein [Salmonella enterica subsp. enterica serovar Muenster]EAY3165540.1 hypothetical protein [Salmonella enterica subsp. enterica serovar Typhimurium]EBS1952338.1 hypothetical protein [Salmonella enterica subsp. enterica serovar Javiana]EBZ6353